MSPNALARVAMERPLRLLLVEDSPADAEVLLLALRRGGLDPAGDRVGTADQLRDALAAGPWDAVLSAYALPGFGAPAALAVVRAADPDLPFVVVSGAIGEDAAVELMRSSASDYVLWDDLARLAPTVEREVREAGNRRARRAADRAAAHLAAVVESSDDAILTKTLDGLITSWNPAAEHLYGWTAAEAVGRNVSFLIPPDRLGELDANMARLRAGDPVGYFETVRLSRDGRRLDVALTLSPVRDADGRLVGVSKTARDVRDRKRAEESLRRSEERYRGLIESIPALVWVSDADGRPVLHNRRWYEFTGQAAGDPAAGRWHQLLHPDDAAEAVAAWDRSKATGEPYAFEYRLRRADGVYRWFFSQKTALTGPAGVEQWVGICTDIDDRKRAEDAVRASEERFRAFMDHSPAAAFIKDEDGRYLYVNATWRRQFGPEPTDGTGKTDYDFWPPDVADLFRASDVACLTRDTVVESEETGRTAAGEEVTWLVMKFPLADGGRRRLGGMAWDITARKRAEDALRLRDRAMRAATQGLLITDPGRPDNPIVYASPGFERITGYEAGEVLGRNCRFLQGKDTDPAAVTQLRKAIRAGEPCTVELLNYRRDGNSFWNELSISPVRDHAGRLTHFVGVQTDVTARRGLEEQFRQVQKMEAVGRLAGGVAHDFNNLLTIINGYSDLLLASLPPGDASRELVAEIHHAGMRSAGLTRQLLAFSRQQVLAPRVLDLNGVVANTENMLRRLIGEDIRLAATLAPGLWAVRADDGQVEQVLMNLAVNARDAMPRGGRLAIETRNVELDEAYARARPDARAGPHALLSVADTGGGMSPEVRARIFEPFFTTKGPGKGTGLGLATVYGIVKQSGGHVTVSSEVGVGTTFEVYFPRTEQKPDGSKTHAALRAPPRGTETVLLAEDDDGVRALTRLVLVGCGYTVLEAGDGDEAVRVAAGHDRPIHLLVTDIVMPGAGGRAVAEQVAWRHPGARVLFVSGYTDDAVIRHGVLRDGVNFLQKPYSPAALAAKVREVLDAPAGT